MKRQPIIAANWKMNLTPSEADRFVQDFLPRIRENDSVEIVLCPAAPCLEGVSRSLAGSRVRLGGQNIYYEIKGAFTGENSAVMLKDLGCAYTIVGHSERRTLFGETNETVNRKIKTALAEGLDVIVCVGETLEQREAEQTEAVLEDHVTHSLEGLSPEDMKRVVIAYEPVWAIGTGKTATPDQAEEAHACIRVLLEGMFDKTVSESTRIQYGGSVKPENISELMSRDNIDGALVGGASLKPDSFALIIEGAS